MAHLHTEMEAEKAVAKEHEQMALERLSVELTGSGEEAVAARVAREKEERVEAMHGRAVRRMRMQGVLAGWETWRSEWAWKRRQRQLLARGAATLAKPRLVRCHAVWKSEWESRRKNPLVVQLRTQLHEAGLLRRELDGTIRSMLAQLAARGQEPEMPVPKPEPQVRITITSL